jgi:magnesium-transporting ATPase (P-type)
MMITGDHPATARAIAQEAGLLDGRGEVVHALEIAHLQNGDLDLCLRKTVVIARATPLDKLRIVESLRRQGFTVAMTGDGVNDAPALRLADIGAAMGRSGTEVARQTADVVIADDDFSTLVEGFVEGRSFWHNMRRALGLLLGGNLGELGLVVGASLLGTGMPLTVGQILAVNAITDILPAIAVILQQPEHRDLTRLQREGASELDVPLLKEVLRRGLATAGPSLAAYLLTLRTGSLPLARSVAFTSVVVTQLAQTLMAGRVEGHLTAPVLYAVGGSLGSLLLAFGIPALRQFLNLVIPPPSAWLLVAGSALAAILLNRLLSGGESPPERGVQQIAAAH